MEPSFEICYLTADIGNYHSFFVLNEGFRMSEPWRSPYVVVKGLSKTEAIVEIVELGLSSYCVPYVVLQPDNFFFFFGSPMHFVQRWCRKY